MSNEHVDSKQANAHPLARRLVALDLQEPPEDRLPAILQASRASAVQSVRRPWRVALAVAAGLAAVAMVLPLAKESPAPDLQSVGFDAELAALVAQSQQMEIGLSTLRRERASWRQLQSLREAQPALSQLDSEIEYWSRVEPQDVVTQRALWRERIDLMQDVAHGEYRPALLMID